MKKLSKHLSLNTKSIQILDNKNLAEIIGGEKAKDTVVSCHYHTCAGTNKTDKR